MKIKIIFQRFVRAMLRDLLLFCPFPHPKVTTSSTSMSDDGTGVKMEATGPGDE